MTLSKSNLKPKKHLKYKIQEYLDSRPAAISMSSIVQILAGHGISQSTFLRDRKIKKASAQSIPSDRLDVYAALFNVSVDDLKNYTINVKPLDEKSADRIKRAVSKAGFGK